MMNQWPLVQVRVGLPGTAYHLEFTSHVHGSPCPAPSKDTGRSAESPLRT